MDGGGALCNRNIGLSGSIDPLQVGDKTAGFDDNEFALPSKACGSLDRSVDTAVPVPVTGDKVHIRPDDDPAVMYFDRAVGGIKTFLHIDITRVRQAFVIGDEGVQQNNLLAMAHWLEVVCFYCASRLLGRECQGSRGTLEPRTVCPTGLSRMRGMAKRRLGEWGVGFGPKSALIGRGQRSESESPTRSIHVSLEIPRLFEDSTSL